MRWVEHRRHSMRDPGGVHLNAAGRELARRVGRATGPFAVSVSSPVPRAVETAIAMGSPAERTHRDLAPIGPSLERAMGPVTSWGDFASAIRRSPALAAYAGRLAAVMVGAAGRIPEGAQALIISHGGVVELSALGALPGLDWSVPEETASYLDGVRLGFEGPCCVEARVLRAPRP